MKEHYLWVDILNIFGCIGVIWMHCTNGPLHNFLGDLSLPYLIGLISHTFAYWPVPVFIMISGFNLIGYSGDWKTFYIRRFKRTVIPFVGWSIFYFIVTYHSIIPIKDFIELFIAGKFCGVMWFFIPLFSVYLCMPFLSTFVKNASLRMLRYYLLIGFIFISFIPCILDLSSISFPQFFPIGTNFLMVAVAGYVLIHDPWFKDNRKMFYCIGIVSAIIHIVILFLFTYVFHQSSKLWLHATYPTNILISIAVFLFISDINWLKIINKFKLSQSIVNQISSCSLGIYLTHPFVIYSINALNLNINLSYYGVIIIYFISFCIVTILKRIPIVKLFVP